jgi:hypothetical protein
MGISTRDLIARRAEGEISICSISWGGANFVGNKPIQYGIQVRKLGLRGPTSEDGLDVRH